MRFQAPFTNAAKPRATLWLAVLTTAGLATALFGPGPARGVGGDELGEALRFRRDFGLSTDVSQVESLLSSPTASAEFGTPLTDAELAAMRRRVDLEDGLVLLATHIDANRGSFGGLALQADGATVDVMVVDGTVVDLNALQDLVPAGARLNLRSVTFSAEELGGVQATVEEALPELQRDGFTIASVGVDVTLNRVVVEVEDPSGGTVAAFTERFGPAVTVEAGRPYTFAACTGRSNCGAPMKGGLKIQSDNDFVCTSGFLGRTVAGGAVYRYVLTAGHCLDPNFGSGIGATWNHPSSPNTPLGTGAFEDFYSGSSADIGAINDSESGAKNFVYTTSNTSFLSITGKVTNSNQYVGRSICRSGLTSGWDCGVIVQTNSTYLVSGVTLNHQWLTSFGSAGGDSGAPMLCGGACGITSATNGSQTVYSTIDWIESEAGLRPCYSATCG